MTQKPTLRDIRSALQQRKDDYTNLKHEFSNEIRSARAEHEAARSVLEGKVAAFVAELLPTPDAPALKVFQAIAVEHNHPQKPQDVRDSLTRQTANATARQAEVITQYGNTDTLASQIQDISTDMRAAQRQIEISRREISDLNDTLFPFDKLNRQLEGMNARPLNAESASYYQRPPGKIAAALRHLTDKPYREVRQLLDYYEQRKMDPLDLAAERSQKQKTAEQTSQNLAGLTKDQTLARQRLAELAELAEQQKTPREILNEVRVATTNMLMSDRALFKAATTAFPNRLDPQETTPLWNRMELFGTLATNLGKQSAEADEIASQLDKPLSNLKKAIHNNNGSQRKAFDLDGKTAKLDQHQSILRHRLVAARDIRSASRRPEAMSVTSSSSSSDSNDLLLWYLIMNNNTANAAHPHAGAVQPLFESGHGGSFAGAGATGGWAETAGNSYFRAEMLGLTPQDASSKGLCLSLPTDIASPAAPSASGTTSFNSLSGDLGLGDRQSLSGFNDMARSLDLDQFGRDLSTLSTDLSSSLSTDWGSGSSSFGSSWGSSTDSGSSWSSSSDSGSSYSSDSGGGSSCSCD